MQCGCWGRVYAAVEVTDRGQVQVVTDRVTTISSVG